jgi:uncharacterized metal-binding protein
MSEPVVSRCAICGIDREEKACRNEGGKGLKTCPTLSLIDLIQEGEQAYQDLAVREFARLASVQEAECYLGRGETPYYPHAGKTRIQEICEFAWKIGAQKLGLAFCIGLSREAKIVNDILTAQGFDVISVVCKVGRMSKEAVLGITDAEKIVPGTPEAACNPIVQARVLNAAKTDLNLLLGLCVGHDSLFIKNAEAHTTVLAVKDRVTGHNPLAAVYNIFHYYRYLMKPGF